MSVVVRTASSGVAPLVSAAFSSEIAQAPSVWHGERSFALNEELNPAVHDPDIATALERIFADDLAHSRKIGYQQWRGRGLVDQMMELLSLPFRKQLSRRGHSFTWPASAPGT